MALGCLTRTDCAVISLSSCVIHWEKRDASEKNRADDQNKRFLFSKTKPETPYPPQWTDPLPLRMRHLRSKQLRTPENPVCVEEHHQLACEARCRWSRSELALCSYIIFGYQILTEEGELNRIDI
ncbi:hypothetical protein NPIL_156791 [Nephila pilipes]|uniref:Uncharacterized protein n=1 Tax=Nephila pilipes TaxID=299642 RepID=A0A8X6NRR2_NEPPI|nr:hypothetical protein NPIL_156791 [Nephila pilipes]